jgi:hypothetical protein
MLGSAVHPPSNSRFTAVQSSGTRPIVDRVLTIDLLHSQELTSNQRLGEKRLPWNEENLYRDGLVVHAKTFAERSYVNETK